MKIFECYFQIHDWKQYLSWHDEYKKNLLDKIDSETLRNQLENKIDINYIKTLCSFESLEFEETDIYFKNINCINSYDELISSIDKKWNIDELESVTLKEIFKSLICKKFKNFIWF